MAMLWDLVDARNEAPGEQVGAQREPTGAHKVVTWKGSRPQLVSSVRPATPTPCTNRRRLG